MSKDLGDLYDRLSQIHDVAKIQLASQQRSESELIRTRINSERQVAALEALSVAFRASLGILNAQTLLLKKIEKNTRQPEIGAVKAVAQLSKPIDNEEK